MTFSDFYIHRGGWLHHLDPRGKIFLVLAVWLLLFVHPGLVFQIAALGLLLIAHLSARIGPRRLSGYLLALLPLSLLMALLRGLFLPLGPVLFMLGPLPVTGQGMASGAAVGVRLLSMALSVLLVLATTQSRELTSALVAFGLPYAWGLSLTLALRFLPDFIDTYHTVRQGMQSRALRFDRGRPWQRLGKLSPVMIAVIVSSLRRSEQMAIALEARAFGPTISMRTDLHPLSLKRPDWIFIAFIVAATIAVVVAGFI
jgi:energy-coupling factor transport system permease protein